MEFIFTSCIIYGRETVWQCNSPRTGIMMLATTKGLVYWVLTVPILFLFLSGVSVSSSQHIKIASQTSINNDRCNLWSPGECPFYIIPHSAKPRQTMQGEATSFIRPSDVVGRGTGKLSGVETSCRARLHRALPVLPEK